MQHARALLPGRVHILSRAASSFVNRAEMSSHIGRRKVILDQFRHNRPSRNQVDHGDEWHRDDPACNGIGGR